MFLSSPIELSQKDNRSKTIKPLSNSLLTDRQRYIKNKLLKKVPDIIIKVNESGIKVTENELTNFFSLGSLTLSYETQKRLFKYLNEVERLSLREITLITCSNEVLTYKQMDSKIRSHLISINRENPKKRKPKNLTKEHIQVIFSLFKKRINDKVNQTGETDLNKLIEVIDTIIGSYPCDIKRTHEIIRDLIERGNLKINKKELTRFNSSKRKRYTNRQVEILFILYWIERRTHKEISEILNLDSDIVRHFCHRKFPPLNYDKMRRVFVPSELVEDIIQNKKSIYATAKESGISAYTLKDRIHKTGREIQSENNSLIMKHPDAAKLWEEKINGMLTPDVSVGSKKQYVWKCSSCKRNFKMSVCYLTNPKRVSLECSNCILKKHGILANEWANWEDLNFDLFKSIYPDCRTKEETRYQGTFKGELVDLVPDLTFTEKGEKVCADVKTNGLDPNVKITIEKNAPHFDRIDILCLRNPDKDYDHSCTGHIDPMTGRTKITPVRFLTPQLIIDSIEDNERKMHFMERLNELMKEREKLPFSGEAGFEKTILKIRKFYETTGRKPTRNEKEFTPIKNALRRGEYEIFGFTKWDPLCFYATDGYVGKGYYGKEGLDQATTRFMNIYASTNFERRPQANDKEMRIILNTIERGEYQRFGITKWAHFIFYATNGSEGKGYCGKKGLKQAVDRIREFYKTTGRKPSRNDKGMKTIYNALRREKRSGAWGNVTSWRSLIGYALNAAGLLYDD